MGGERGGGADGGMGGGGGGIGGAGGGGGADNGGGGGGDGGEGGNGGNGGLAGGDGGGHAMWCVPMVVCALSGESTSHSESSAFVLWKGGGGSEHAILSQHLQQASKPSLSRRPCRQSQR